MNSPEEPNRENKRTKNNSTNHTPIISYQHDVDPLEQFFLKALFGDKKYDMEAETPNAVTTNEQQYTSATTSTETTTTATTTTTTTINTSPTNTTRVYRTVPSGREAYPTITSFPKRTFSTRPLVLEGAPPDSHQTKANHDLPTFAPRSSTGLMISEENLKYVSSQYTTKSNSAAPTTTKSPVSSPTDSSFSQRLSSLNESKKRTLSGAFKSSVQSATSSTTNNNSATPPTTRQSFFSSQPTIELEMEEYEEEPFFGPRLFDNPKYNMVEEEDIDMENEDDGANDNSGGQQTDSEEEYELEDTSEEENIVVPTALPVIEIQDSDDENPVATNQAPTQFDNALTTQQTTHYSSAQINNVHTQAATTNEATTQVDNAYYSCAQTDYSGTQAASPIIISDDSDEEQETAYADFSNMNAQDAYSQQAARQDLLASMPPEIISRIPEQLLQDPTVSEEIIRSYMDLPPPGFEYVDVDTENGAVRVLVSEQNLYASFTSNDEEDDNDYQFEEPEEMEYDSNGGYYDSNGDYFDGNDEYSDKDDYPSYDDMDQYDGEDSESNHEDGEMPTIKVKNEDATPSLYQDQLVVNAIAQEADLSDDEEDVFYDVEFNDVDENGSFLSNHASSSLQEPSPIYASDLDFEFNVAATNLQQTGHIATTHEQVREQNGNEDASFTIQARPTQQQATANTANTWYLGRRNYLEEDEKDDGLEPLNSAPATAESPFLIHSNETTESNTNHSINNSMEELDIPLIPNNSTNTASPISPNPTSPTIPPIPTMPSILSMPSIPSFPSFPSTETEPAMPSTQIKPVIPATQTEPALPTIPTPTMPTIPSPTMPTLNTFTSTQDNMQIDSQYESLPSFHADTQLIPESWQDEEARVISTHIEANPVEAEGNRNVTEYDDVIKDKSLRIWWYDACVGDNKASINLFGKAYDQTHKKYVSCFVVIENIQREIFVLPRKYKLDDEDQMTQSIVTLDDVQEELREKMKHKDIKNYAMEVVTKKYTFDLPDVPEETEYIRLRYSYNDYYMHEGTSGQTFSRMFGSSVRIMEQFLIENNIMGPCWLELKNIYGLASKQSWCKVEAGTTSPSNCSVLIDTQDLLDPPPLNIMSLSVHTNLNRKDRANEIYSVCGFVCPDADINNQQSATSLPFHRFAITRLVKKDSIIKNDQAVSAHLQAKQERQKTNLRIELEQTEESLLHKFLGHIQIYDPDIIVGHNFTNVDLDILLHRMKKVNAYGWSRLGRRRLEKWPILQDGPGGTGTSTFSEELMMSGRLICDTYIASKPLVKAKSYRLVDLAHSELNIEYGELTSDLIKEYRKAGTLDLELARHGSFEAYLTFSLMVKLQILPLTKQLTNLSGNLWYRSMNGARSERNEYLLLHTFYNKGYVCPDKPNKYKKDADIFAIDDNLELEQTSKNRKGANGKPVSYMGGLVLEPKTGLYDRYVILLDFNSLYPSIMQEYNVCFTTMKRSPESTDINELPVTPSPDCPQGILPTLVKTFVDQRRKVKDLMKNENLSKSTITKYNIEQMALKLTANSMYGCLGSSVSRFYARPLAMYITSKGRDILRATVELAESKNLDVIYGDTDSIMINTNRKTLRNAKDIGEKFMNQVNNLYNVLDIGLDGFFRHTLLLRKKKYAALLVKEKPDGSGLQESFEVKGLDLVRRDWCDLSHDVSGHVLSIILSDKNREDVVREIHDYMKNTGARIINNEFQLDDFIIRKQLTKAPEEYKKSKSQPHVKVAKDMRRSGISVKAGDTIPHVMCLVEDPNGSGTLLSEACMPEDVVNNKACLDLQYYLHKQILPPVNRLCGPIEGADMESLASSLGLNKEEMIARLDDDMEEITEEETLERVDEPETVLFSGPERYSNIEPLVLRCNNCHHEAQYVSQESISSALSDTSTSLICEACQGEISAPSIYIQVLQKIRGDIQAYYDCAYTCEKSCGFSTRSISTGTVEGCACGCRIVREFSHRQMYDSLSYMKYLFDCVGDSNTFAPVKNLISEYMKLSSYKFININNIFNDQNL